MSMHLQSSDTCPCLDGKGTKYITTMTADNRKSDRSFNSTFSLRQEQMTLSRTGWDRNQQAASTTAAVATVAATTSMTPPIVSTPTSAAAATNRHTPMGSAAVAVTAVTAMLILVRTPWRQQRQRRRRRRWSLVSRRSCCRSRRRRPSPPRPPPCTRPTRCRHNSPTRDGLYSVLARVFYTVVHDVWGGTKKFLLKSF